MRGPGARAARRERRGQVHGGQDPDGCLPPGRRQRAGVWHERRARQHAGCVAARHRGGLSGYGPVRRAVGGREHLHGSSGDPSRRLARRGGDAPACRREPGEPGGGPGRGNAARRAERGPEAPGCDRARAHARRPCADPGRTHRGAVQPRGGRPVSHHPAPRCRGHGDPLHLASARRGLHHRRSLCGLSGRSARRWRRHRRGRRAQPGSRHGRAVHQPAIPQGGRGHRRSRARGA